MLVQLKFRDLYAVRRMQMAAEALGRREHDVFDGEMYRVLAEELELHMDVGVFPSTLQFDEAYFQAILDCEVKLWHWIHQAVEMHDMKIMLGIERTLVKT